MLYRWSKLLGCWALIGLLAACGGSSGPVGAPGDGGSDDGGGDDGGGGPPPSPFTAPSEQQALYYINDLPADLDAVQAAFNQGGFTPFADLPLSNAVAYDGFMEVLFTSTPNANITSSATFTVNMLTGETLGSATNFMGMVYNSEADANELALYEGGVNFVGGTLSTGALNEANIAIQIDGAFDNGLQELTVAGEIDGKIFGPSAEGLYASGSYFGLGQDITFVADGVPVYGSATLWALKD